jgi:cellulose synthase (UDP-forming)
MSERSATTAEDYSHTHHVGSATLLLLLLVGAVGVLYYATFLFNQENRGDLVAYLFVVVAEGLIMYQVFMAYWTILAGSYNPKDFRYHGAQQKLFGKVKHPEPTSPIYIEGKKVAVDVFITVYGEPLEVITETVMSAKYILGKHSTYILDDGKSDDVMTLAEQLGVGYIRRDDNEGAKAGNVNNALSKTSGEYFVIFDADHVPEPNFLIETMPPFVTKKVAFVQTPQFYKNTEENSIARGAAYTQELFYRFICTGKNRFNAAFCVGTNVVFRRPAVESIGGIYQDSKSEDIWTSVLLHEKGYRTVFIPDVLAEGQAPDNMPAFTKQQLRWATGGFEILLTHNPLFSKRLNFDQKMQYLATTTFYLLGLSVALLFLVPPLSIFLGLTPVSGYGTISDWAMHYLAFYGLQFAVIIYCMKGLKFDALVLAVGSFPTYLKALWHVVRAKDVRWSVTNKKNADSPYNFIVPQIVVFCFLLAASAVGAWQLLQGHPVSLALVWNMFNTYLFWRYLRMATSIHEPEPSREFGLTAKDSV